MNSLTNAGRGSDMAVSNPNSITGCSRIDSADGKGYGISDRKNMTPIMRGKNGDDLLEDGS